MVRAGVEVVGSFDIVDQHDSISQYSAIKMAFIDGNDRVEYRDMWGKKSAQLIA